MTDLLLSYEARAALWKRYQPSFESEVSFHKDKKKNGIRIISNLFLERKLAVWQIATKKYTEPLLNCYGSPAEHAYSKPSLRNKKP